MATLRQAIECLRENGTLPLSGTVSTRGLHQKFHPAPSGSTRALLLQIFGSVSKKLPWAIILCRFKDSAPDPTVEDPIEKFYREIFTPGSGGLVEYWRDVSLGAIDITGSRVFGWVVIDIPRDEAGGSSKTVNNGPGRSGLVDYAISAVCRDGGDPLEGFHSQIAVYTQNWSIDGKKKVGDWSDWGRFWIDGSADRRGKVTLTPPHNGNITAHEMGHGFSMGHDVGPDLMTDYSDPCCIMSRDGLFIHPKWGRTFGPAVCLPHLMQRDWMYKRRVFFDDGGWMSQPEGITLPLAPISRPGARANLGIKLAYRREETNWDYYLEYMIPTEWNRGAGVPVAPYLLIRRIVSISGIGDRPAYLGFIAVPTAVGIISELVEPSGNVRFQVELTDLPGPILKVRAKKL